jgi:hypothetical protein
MKRILSRFFLSHRGLPYAQRLNPKKTSQLEELPRELNMS